MVFTSILEAATKSLNEELTLNIQRQTADDIKAAVTKAQGRS